MKNSQNQNSPNVQKDAVQYKSPTFFIQLGLVFALLLAYLAIEFKTYSTPIDDDVIVFKKNFEEEEPPVIIEKPEPQPVTQQPPVDMGKVETIDNNSAEEETNLVSTETEITDKIDPYDFSQIKNAKVVEPPSPDYDIKDVEEVSIFPGCKGNNETLKKCLSKEIGQMVAKNFNAELANDLGLPTGVRRISVKFVIDENGNISEIKTIAPHKSLESEAERVMNKIPQLKPGKINGKSVKVRYTIPITYSVE